MKAAEVPLAVAAGVATASAFDLKVEDAIVLHDSNRLAVRLLPCDVLARVAHIAHQAGAAFEVEVARRLAETDSPVAELDPRVEPRVYVRDGFAVTLWTYYEPVRYTPELADTDRELLSNTVKCGAVRLMDRIPSCSSRHRAARVRPCARTACAGLSTSCWASSTRSVAKP